MDKERIEMLSALKFSAHALVWMLLMVQSSAFAHDFGQSAPVKCANVSPGNDGEHTVGRFPGPRNHLKMVNQDLGTLSLAGELPGFLGHQFRVRYWLMEPGGMIADHCHEDRPAIVYLLSGKVMETYIDPETGAAKSRELKRGSVVVEGNGTHHWWVNQSKDQNVTMIAVDIPNDQPPSIHSLPNVSDSGVEIKLFEPGRDCTVFDDKRCILNLKTQYPHIEALFGYKLEASRVVFEKGGVLGIRNHAEHPGFAYVLEGTLHERTYSFSGAEVRSETVVRRTNDLSFMNKGKWNSWVNKTDGDGKAELILFRFDFDEALGAEGG